MIGFESHISGCVGLNPTSNPCSYGTPVDIFNDGELIAHGLFSRDDRTKLRIRRVGAGEFIVSTEDGKDPTSAQISRINNRIVMVERTTVTSTNVFL